MKNTPCRCGADDCSRCHPENYHFGVYITSDPDEFEVQYLGMYEGYEVVGPNRFRKTYDAEVADEFVDDGILDASAFVKAHVLPDYAETICEAK